MFDFVSDPAFRDSPVAYSVVASDGSQIAVNGRFRALFGLDDDATVTVEEITHPADREATADYFGSWAAGSDETVRVEKRYIRRDGSVFWGRLTATPIDVDDERLLLGVIEDIDDERRLRVLEAGAARARAAMVSRASHELRNPLHVITGLAELLAESDLGDGQRRQAEAILSEANGLKRVVDELLEFGRADAGNLRLQPIDFTLRPLVARVDRGHGPTARDKGIDLMIEVDDDVPLHVHGDPDRLLQVLSNIVGNAVKFTDDGRVTVRVVPGGRQSEVQFIVRDSGPGIPEDQLRSIFEPFVQVDQQRAGVGLGLAIASSLVGLMGGSIVAENSTPGASFSVTIPLPEADGPVSEPAEPASAAGGHLGSSRVLVVEDSAENQLLARGQLEAHGVVCEIAEDGFEALGLLETEAYDLVLMDWHLPSISGLETIRRWRFREVELRRERLPIIVVTARAMAQDARTCLDAGADDYLRKPASLADIGRVLRTWLPSADELAESTSLLDRSAVDTLVDDIGDPGLVVTLLKTYLTELPVRVERILVAGEESSEVSGVEEAAHVLKSTSAIVGAAALSDLAAELEQSARNGSAPSEAQREQLRTLAASTETEIASIAAGLEGTG